MEIFFFFQRNTFIFTQMVLNTEMLTITITYFYRMFIIVQILLLNHKGFFHLAAMHHFMFI